MKLFLTSRVVEPHLIPLLPNSRSYNPQIFDQMALEKLSVLLSVRGGQGRYMRNREALVILHVSKSYSRACTE